MIVPSSTFLPLNWKSYFESWINTDDISYKFSPFFETSTYLFDKIFSPHGKKMKQYWDFYPDIDIRSQREQQSSQIILTYCNSLVADPLWLCLT